MNPKPSLRRDSLEKAARKEARAIADPAQYGWCQSEGDGIKEPGISQLQDGISKAIVRFAQRHGAKVRRETIKEAVDSLTNSQGGPIHTFPEVNSERYRAQGETIKLVIKRLLSLTPRGPEKGRAK